MTGYLANDCLTCIPGTKTFWHDLLEWLPDLEDTTGGYTSYGLLADKIERKSSPDYIVRNATYFRKLDVSVPTISLLQDIQEGWLRQQQVEVCNNSRVTVFNSEYTRAMYPEIIGDVRVIPLGVDSELFVPEARRKEYDVLFVGASTVYPKGFDILLDIITKTDYKFCLVMKENYQLEHERVAVFNNVNSKQLKNIYNESKVLVCTSRQEAQHLVGIEAGFCNVPIICSNVGIYYNRKDGGWGDHANEDYVGAITIMLNNLDKYNPREYWLSQGVDKESCKVSWQKLVKEIV